MHRGAAEYLIALKTGAVKRVLRRNTGMQGEKRFSPDTHRQPAPHGATARTAGAILRRRAGRERPGRAGLLLPGHRGERRPPALFIAHLRG